MWLLLTNLQTLLTPASAISQVLKTSISLSRSYYSIPLSLRVLSIFSSISQFISLFLSGNALASRFTCLLLRACRYTLQFLRFCFSSIILLLLTYFSDKFDFSVCSLYWMCRYMEELPRSSFFALM
jgi:hypothetical protein